MNKTIIEELYKGKINPSEQIFPNNSDYQKKLDEFGKIRAKISSLLSEEEGKRIEGLWSEIQAMELKETFSCGLKLGSLLMMELLKSE